MSSFEPQPAADLNIREQIARIDNLLIDSQKKQREFHLAFWQVAATLLGGAAAFFAGGVAVVKLFGS